MKKLIVLMITAFVPIALLAQSTPLTSLHDRCINKPGFETTEIMPGALSFDWGKEVELSQVKEMMKSIDKIRILKYNSEPDNSGLDKLWKKMQKATADEAFA